MLKHYLCSQMQYTSMLTNYPTQRTKKYMNLQILQFRIIKIYLILLHITYNLEKVFLILYLISSIVSNNHYKSFYLKIIKYNFF